ncbi:MAG: hypothetical protein KDD84_00925 [Caldilineaceae bacterium]|nr:hypothetical protein [Caldilineaceae bacterium]
MTDRTWAFVVRIWREEGTSIRGSLQHVTTGDLHYFSDLEHLLQLLATEIPESATPHPVDDVPTHDFHERRTE